MACQMGQKNAKMAFCVDVVGVFGKETVGLCDTDEQFQTVTVGQLKDKMLHKLPFKDWPEDREFFFEYKKLEGDNALLHENGVKHKSIIHMALVYDQKEFVGKKDDEESEARASADKEECCKQKEMEKIQVLLCVSGKPEKIMAVFCNTKEEMQKMTVQLLKRQIERNVCLDHEDIRVDEVYVHGKQLEESSLLSDHGVKHMSTVDAKVSILSFVDFGCIYEELFLNLSQHEKNDKKHRSMEYLADFEKPSGSVDHPTT